MDHTNYFLFHSDSYDTSYDVQQVKWYASGYSYIV